MRRIRVKRGAGPGGLVERRPAAVWFLRAAGALVVAVLTVPVALLGALAGAWSAARDSWRAYRRWAFQ